MYLPKFLLLLAFFSFANGLEISNVLDKIPAKVKAESSAKLAEGLSSMFSTRLKAQTVDKLSSPPVPLLPLLPNYPFPEFTCLNATDTEFDLIDDELLRISVVFKMLTDLTTTGLDTIKDIFSFKQMPSGAVIILWKLEMSQLAINSDAFASLSIFGKDETVQNASFSFQGTNSHLEISNLGLNLFVEVKALPLYEKLKLTQLNIDLGIPEVNWPADWLLEAVTPDEGGVVFNQTVNAGDVVESGVELIWGLVKDLGLVNMLECALDFIVNDCAVANLVNEEYDSGCFGSVSNSSFGLPWFGHKHFGVNTYSCTSATEVTSGTSQVTNGPSTSEAVTTNNPATNNPTTDGPTTINPGTNGPTTNNPATSTVITDATTKESTSSKANTFNTELFFFFLIALVIQ